MSKPLAMNMYAQNASGIFVPVLQQPGSTATQPITSSPQVVVGLFDGGTSITAWQDAKAQGTTGNSGYGMGTTDVFLFNGTSLDAQRGNLDNITLITASGVTTTQNSADQTNFNGRGLKVYFNMTTVGTGSVTIHVQGKDPTTGTYFDILVGTAVVTNVFSVYTVYPGITATANASASDFIPRTWRVQAVANNANATTYTVACAVEV